MQDGDAWPDEILMSNTTQEEWKLELERVLPQLKVTIRSGVYVFVCAYLVIDRK